MIHVGNGVYFERQADGRVRVLTGQTPGAAIVCEVLLPVDAWALTVAQMSERGEAPEVVAEARTLHTKSKPPAPAPAIQAAAPKRGRR